MQLSYRGVTYNHSPKNVEIIDSDVTGKYRGNTLHFHQLKENPGSQDDVELKYRGVLYHTHH